MKKSKHLSKLFVVLSLALVVAAPTFRTAPSAPSDGTIQLMALLEDISAKK